MNTQTIDQVLTLLLLAAGVSLVFLIGGFIADLIDNRSTNA